MERIFVGLDVSKDRLDVHVRPTDDSFAVAYDEEGLTMLVSQLGLLQPTLIVLEATGGYEVKVAAVLANAGLPVAVVNPRQIRDFARATGQLAKTGRVGRAGDCAVRRNRAAGGAATGHGTGASAGRTRSPTSATRRDGRG